MGKIIAIIVIATIVGVITTAVLKVAGIDPWWADAIGTSATIFATLEGMQIWAKSELANEARS